MEPWRATVLTLFPDMFPGPLAYSLAGKALSARVWDLETMDIRGFTSDKHAAVDDAPFGGGPGLVMRADVVDAALTGIGLSQPEGEVAADTAEPPRPLIYLTPRGARLTQARVRELADGPGVVVLCGRYEGIDQRAVEAWRMEELSVGDFVLSGGEPAAIILIDACVRLLDGVMGSEESPREESFEGGLLEYPHYTRPRSWRDREVPEVLVSGDHAKVRAWRRAEAERITKERRPDLWSAYETATDRAEDRGSEK